MSERADIAAGPELMGGVRCLTPLSTRWLPLALLAVMLVSLVWLVRGDYEADIETNDASMYLLSSQAILRGEGYAYLGQPFTIRPPGMSVLFAPILATRGRDFGALNLLVSLFGVAGALILYYRALPVAGAWAAAGCALCLWFNPGYQHFCNQSMSDVPGIVFMLGSLLLERWARKRPSWKRDVCVGALIGLGTYVRTVIVLALAAIVLARILDHVRQHRRQPDSGWNWPRFARERLLALIVGTVLVAGPWSVRNALVANESPADQNFIASYGTGLARADPGDPNSDARPLSDVLATIPVRAKQVAQTVGARFEGRGAGGPTVWILAPLMLAAVIVVLVRRSEPAAFLFLLVLAVLLVYFGFRARLVLPLFVIGMVACAEVTVGWLAPRIGWSRASAAFGVAALALAAIDFQTGGYRTTIGPRQAQRIEQAAAQNAVLGPDARVAARIGWHHSLYLGRPVWSIRFALDRARRGAATEANDGEPSAGGAVEAQALRDLVAKYGLDAILVGTEPGESALLPLYTTLYGPGQRAGAGWVFRTHP